MSLTARSWAVLSRTSSSKQTGASPVFTLAPFSASALRLDCAQARVRAAWPRSGVTWERGPATRGSLTEHSHFHRISCLYVHAARRRREFPGRRAGHSGPIPVVVRLSSGRVFIHLGRFVRPPLMHLSTNEESTDVQTPLYGEITKDFLEHS